MKVFFYCRTGVHTSLITAAIHLGWLPRHRSAWDHEVAKIPYFDNQEYQYLGTPIFLGYDQFHHQVYSFGTWSEKEVIPKAVDSLLKLEGISADQYLLVDTLQVESPLTILGGLLSIKYGKHKYGRALALKGIGKSYPKMLQLLDNLQHLLKK